MSLVLIFMLALVGGMPGNRIPKQLNWRKGDTDRQTTSIGLQPHTNIRTNIKQWFPVLPFSTLMRKPFGRKIASKVVRNDGDNENYQKEEENYKMFLKKNEVNNEQLSMVDRLIR